MQDGFGLNSGITITGGDGALLVNGEAFSWRPWVANGNKSLVNKKGQFEIPAEALSMFDMLWPRPGKFAGRRADLQKLTRCRLVDYWRWTKHYPIKSGDEENDF